jgi:hypothetical protein
MELFNRIYRAKTGEQQDIPEEIENELIEFINSVKMGIFGNDGDNLMEYIILNPYQLQKLREFEIRLNYPFDYEDISERVIMGDLTDEELNDDFLLEFYQTYEIMEKNVDIILDKINMRGINNLNKIDKEILSTI